jgi:hypothetical protein
MSMILKSGVFYFSFKLKPFGVVLKIFQILIASHISKLSYFISLPFLTTTKHNALWISR